MGQGDFMPISGHHKKPLDPKRIKKIKEGWKKADKIHQEAMKHHHEVDVPTAEKILEDELGEL